MKLLTKEQARELDHLAINELGISGIELMGNAGKEVAKYTQNVIFGMHNPKIAICCGKGNNAGDGYKTALHLADAGIITQIIILIDKNQINGDSLYYYNKCVDRKLNIKHSNEPPNEHFDLIIDALLGTGFEGELRSPFAEFTKWINLQKSYKLAIDVPAGINATTGVVSKNALKVDATITMGMVKVGMQLEPAKSYCGEIIPVDIGFPDLYSKLTGKKFKMTSEKLAFQHLKAPPLNTYKQKRGKVLIVAGSRGMTGAAILSSLGAVRSGAGLVATCAPSSLNNIYETNIIEGLTVSCEDSGIGYLNDNNYKEIDQYFDWADVLLIGPGLGKNDSTGLLVKKIVTNFTKPIIIDADGLNCFINNMELFNSIKSDYIITPHHGEFARLHKVGVDTVADHFIEYIQQFVYSFKGTLVAKNAPTIIAHGEEIVINSSGNQGLATGGTGDVLSGVIASLVAQGIHTKIAAELGVFIHGKAADLAAVQKGYRGLIASDLLEYIPQAIMKYE